MLKQPFGWETQKDSGWFTFVLQELVHFMVTVVQRYKEDVATMQLE